MIQLQTGPAWLLLAIAGLVFFGPTGLLCTLLLWACQTDLAARRIPNFLSFGGLAAGLLCQALWPDGLGLLAGLKGAALGLALFLPLYLLRAMGAGDVKLMAMVGAFLGPQQVFGAALSSIIVGGVMSLLLVLVKRGAAAQLWFNLRLMWFEAAAKLAGGKLPVVEQPAASAGRLPYALAIALGTFVFLLAQHYGWIARG